MESLLNLLEALANQAQHPSLPGPLDRVPAPLKALLQAIPSPVQPLMALPGQVAMQVGPRLLDADQQAARALSGGGIAGMALLNRAGLMHTTRANQADLAGLLAAFNNAPGNPYARALVTNEAFAGEHGGLEAGVLNTATDPLNYLGPVAKAAEVAGLGKVAGALNAANSALNLPGEVAGMGAKRVLRPLLQSAPVRQALAGLGDRLGLAAGADTARAAADQAAQAAKRANALELLPTAPEAQDYRKFARLAGLPSPKGVAREASPLAPGSFNLLKVAKQGAPGEPVAYPNALNFIPREAVTPAEEAAAKEAAYGPARALADLNPVPTAPPDFPALTGDRREILARLSPGDLRKLVSTAYNDVPKAITNAFNARPDPVDLAERSIERITTNETLVARLQQRDPHLAALIGALPEPVQAAQGAGDLGAALSNVDIPPSVTDPAERAAWQARYAGQSQAGTDILAAGDKVAGSDVTQAELNAMNPQDRIAALRRLAGGDIAAGGGGMGLTPGGVGLLPNSAIRGLIGAGGGGLLGGATGAAAGYAQGDRGEALLRDATAGGALGAGIGGGAGAAFPELERALVAGAGKAAGALDDTVLDPQTLRTAHALAAQAWQASKGAKGIRAGEFLREFNTLWRAQVTATGRNLAQDAATTRLIVNEFGPEFGDATAQDARAMFAQLRDNALSPDKVAKYGDYGAFLQDTGLDRLIDDKGGLADLYGVSLMNEQGAHTGRATLLQRAAIGTGIGFGNAAAKISPASLLTGGARAALEPYVGTFFRTLNGWQHDAPRLAFALKAAGQDFPALANDFLGDLAAQGVDTTALESLGGRFAPDDVKALVMATPGRTGLAQQAAKEWGVLTEAAVRYRAERIAHLFGDFSEKATPDWQRQVGKVFPFSSWAMKYAPVLAEIAARHPAATTSLVVALARSAEATKAKGEQGYRAGTIPISTETPVLGGPARLLLGGKRGTVRVNPVALLSPVGGEIFAGGDENSPPTTAYQKATQGLGPLGLNPHPLIQAAAYVTGQDYRAPGNLSRTAGLEQLPQLLPGALGTTIPSGRVLLDAARKPIEAALSGAGIATTGPASASDPVMKRYAELVFATTGKPVGDRSNGAYLAGTTPEARALYDRALRETVLAGAASNATSLVSPVSASGTGADAEAAQQARRPVLAAQDQIDQLPPVQGALLQQQIDQYKQAHPESAVYDGTSPYARAQLLLADWERQNAMLGFFPEIYNYQRQVAMEELGLLDKGTLANKQRQLDAAGKATAIPGVENRLRVTPGLADALRALNQPRR